MIINLLPGQLSLLARLVARAESFRAKWASLIVRYVQVADLVQGVEALIRLAGAFLKLSEA